MVRAHRAGERLSRRCEEGGRGAFRNATGSRQPRELQSPDPVPKFRKRVRNADVQIHTLMVIFMLGDVVVIAAETPLAGIGSRYDYDEFSGRGK